jgi:pantoate--beta-alanine ligase
VAKLFNIVRPDLAFFGQKDFQQLKIVERLARDLAFPVKVVGLPTVREKDGVAMSSRNAYLDEQERMAARVLSLALKAARDSYEFGLTDPEALVAGMERDVANEPRARLEYAAVVDPTTLEPLAGPIEGPARALIAARVGDTRLIDNLPIAE